MAGRPKIFNEEQAIDKAMQVFWDKCYDSASADELLAAMGIGKGSFYLSFKGGKQELYERSVKQFSDNFYRNFMEGMAKADDEITFIKSFFLSLADSTDGSKNRGCYIGNALVQLSEKDKNVRDIAAGLLHKFQVAFAAAIKKAQEAGTLHTTHDPEVLAWHLSNLWNGINVTRRMEKSPEKLRTLIELNLSILQL